MLTFLCLLWIFLAAFDAGHTASMLHRHGVEIEMNGAIRKLCAWWGIDKGVLVGIFIPTCAIAGLGWLFHLQTLMAILVVLRIALLAFQIKYQLTNAH